MNKSISWRHLHTTSCIEIREPLNIILILFQSRIIFLIMSEQAAASNGFVLPEKYSDDILDENGNKMSKRYELYHIIIGISSIQMIFLLVRTLETGTLTGNQPCSEFKKRQKMLLKQKEQAEKKVR